MGLDRVLERDRRMLPGSSVHLVPTFAAASVACVLAVVAWLVRSSTGTRLLAVSLGATATWSTGRLVAVVTPGPGAGDPLLGVTVFAAGVAAVAWAVYAVEYTDRNGRPSLRWLVALSAVPVAVAVAVVTTEFHGLVWSTTGGVHPAPGARGPLWYALTGYVFLSTGVAAAVHVEMAVLSENVYRGQALGLVVAALVPPFVAALSLTGATGALDLTPDALVFSGAVLIGSAFRDRMLGALPLAKEMARNQVIEELSTGVIVIDETGRVVDCNPAAAALAVTDDGAVTEGSPGELVGSRLVEVFPSVAHPVSDTHRVWVGDDDRRQYEVSVESLRRGYDAVSGRVLTVEDVTQRYRRAERLRQQRSFIDQAIDTLDDVFYHIAPDGTLERWNDRLVEITGHDDEAAAAMRPREFFAPDHRDRITETVQRTRREGSTTVEADLLGPDGERLPHEFRTTRLTDADGEFAGLVGVGRDVSERKRRERELRTFERAVENVGHAIYWTDTDGTVEYVNGAFERQTGYEATEVVGETPALLDAGDHDGSEELPGSFRRALRTGEPVTEESVNHRSDGGRYTVKRSITPVHRDGEVDRLVVSSVDITERVRRDQHRSVLERVLRHDLRNNLNEALLATQMARDTATDEVTTYLDAVQETVEETLSLGEQVEQSRRLFDGEAGRVTLDLTASVHEQVSTLRTQHPEVSVSVDVPEHAVVETTDLLDRALMNVLQNAVEHNDADAPHLEVSIERRPETGEVVLSVADNGPGLPESEVAVLESDTEDPLEHLSGFGLWFVNWALSVAGGSVEFAENDPRGTVVRLVLPAARTPVVN